MFFKTWIARHSKLLTLEQPMVYSCVVGEKFLPVRDSETEIAMEARKAVLGMASYVGV